jgi:low temperature requirement protein LtrA
MSAESRAPLFRKRDDEKSQRVTNIELFYDLVFVFAVTQLSHHLEAHLSLIGAVETAILFLAVWWLWIYTSWATNWLDPEHGTVRALIIAMMLGGLVMSAAIPDAFGAAGWVFALAYVAMQLLRTLGIAFMSRGVDRQRVRNFLRIAFYFALSLPLWIAGAMNPVALRIPLWAAAVAIEYLGPFVFFATPGLGRSRASDWDISGAHMAERCALFIIIALGEAILVTGATFAEGTHDAMAGAAFLASFAGSVAMWWIYFDTGAKRAGEAMDSDEDAGRLARSAYTYLHMPIVGGIVVTAVADAMMLKHPSDPVSSAFVLTACGGPFLFLLGNTMFKWITAHRPRPPLSHGIGGVLLILTGWAGLALNLTTLTVGALAGAALIAAAAWEWFSLHGGWQRWTPWMRRSTAIALEESER